MLCNNNSKKINKALELLSSSNKFHYSRIIILSGIFLCIFFFSIISYSFYKINQVELIKNEYYERGRQETIKHFREFTKDNSDVKAIYKEWRNKHNYSKQ